MRSDGSIEPGGYSPASIAARSWSRTCVVGLVRWMLVNTVGVPTFLVAIDRSSRGKW